MFHVGHCPGVTNVDNDDEGYVDQVHLLTCVRNLENDDSMTTMTVSSNRFIVSDGRVDRFVVLVVRIGHLLALVVQIHRYIVLGIYGFAF